MKRELLNKQIGINIRKFRLLNDLSQENLALSAGIYPAYLGRLERGEKCPTVDTLLKISDALNVSISDLLSFDNTKDALDSEIIHRIERAVINIPLEKRKEAVSILEDIANILK